MSDLSFNEILSRTAKARRDLTVADIAVLTNLDLNDEFWTPSKLHDALEVMQTALKQVLSKKKSRKESLGRLLCETLKIIYQKSGGNTKKYFHLQKDLKFNTNRNNNFNKLKLWDFVENDKGRWRITEKGVLFASGAETAFTRIEVRNRRRTGNNEKPKFIDEILKEEPRWHQRADYISPQSSVQRSLF